MIISLLLFCSFLILLYYYILHYEKFVRHINNIPSMPSHPLLGHTITLWLCTQENLWKLQRKLCKEYYPLYKLWLGSIAMVSVHHPDDLEKVLSNPKHHLSKGYLYDSLKPWLGTGLLISDGQKWHSRRKILTPTFHFNILKQFIEILIEEGNHITQSLRNVKDSTVDNLVSFVSHHTLNAICETAMGISLENMGEFQQQYRKVVHEMGDILIYRIMRPWLHLDMTFALTPMGRKHAKNLKILHGFTEKIIAERKQYHERTNKQYLKHLESDVELSNTDEEIMGIKKKRSAMLDLLIAASYNNEINNSDIREEIDTFTFEVRISLNSYLVPSGAIMQIHIFDIHRDPNFWPNPDVFDPDRFLPEKIQKRHPYSYLPFSAGSRNCIGQRFAMLEMKTVIAALVNNFYLESVDYLKNLRFKLDMITRVTHPIRVKFVPIKHS
ncbi:cytochrome P450 4C1-like [Pogonomyrmex barbatus]|uniref:Cytochrome P450 4C1-like n=1 Tax=Pogonomyrmex barbatus TaxID=144034 RepID=A0A6I9WHM9_9HYME|nr:cytochrome P450 4C1-like [Pogonomyrmex barbatus]